MTWPQPQISLFLSRLALGLQWQMAVIVFFSLWCVTLPCVFWAAVRNGGGLEALWSVLPTCYTLMQIPLVLSYTTLDWEKRSASIREGLKTSIAEAKGGATRAHETTKLLP
jgi:Na+-driven multidrug efflux pump